MFQKAKREFAECWQLFTWHLHCIYNYLHSIYVVLSIISNLEMILKYIKEVICKQYAILYKGLKHPQILVSEGGPGTNPLYILRDDCMFSAYRTIYKQVNICKMNFIIGNDFFFNNVTFKKNKFIYLSLAALGLHCCSRAFSSCGERGATLRCSAWASHCGGFSLFRCTGSRRASFSSCGSWALERRLSSCSARAQLLRGMWDLPRPGLEPVFPALAGGFLSTVPPGKSHDFCFNLQTLS